MTSRYGAGDVLHITRFSLGRGAKPVDAWAIAESSASVTFVHGYASTGSSISPVRWYLGAYGEEWHVAPPDEWPDEVCAAVALYQLTGTTEP